MVNHEAKIKEFFSEYEARFNRSLQEPPVVDVNGVVESFAPYFVEASPAGVHGGKNGWLFKMMIPRGFAYYKKIGTKSMKIISLDITQLDDYHAMAKVHWNSRYLNKDGKEVQIEFDNLYFLQVLGDNAKIFAYVTGDEQKILKERGLI
jgi:hypothetical protein